MDDSMRFERSSHVIWILSNKTDRKSPIRESTYYLRKNMWDMHKDTFQEEKYPMNDVRHNNNDEPGKWHYVYNDEKIIFTINQD